MNSQFLSWGTVLSLKQTSNDTMSGLLGRYPVSFRFISKNEVHMFLSTQADQAQTGELSARLAPYAQEFGQLQVMIDGPKLVVICRAPKKLKPLHLTRLNTVVQQELSNAGILPRTVCETCGNYGTTVALNQSQISVLCDQCVGAAAQKAKKGNAFTGLLGAILGAVIGAVPWLIVTALSWYSGYLAILVGFSAFFFYRMFNGSRGRLWASFCVAVSTIGAVFVSEIFGYYFSGQFQTLGELFNWYMYSLSAGNGIILYNLFLAAVFTLLGIFFAILRIKHFIYTDSVVELAKVAPPAIPGQAAPAQIPATAPAQIPAPASAPMPTADANAAAETVARD